MGLLAHHHIGRFARRHTAHHIDRPWADCCHLFAQAYDALDWGLDEVHVCFVVVVDIAVDDCFVVVALCPIHCLEPGAMVSVRVCRPKIRLVQANLDLVGWMACSNHLET